MLLVINASPYEVNKQTQREREVVRAHVGETGIPLLFVNLIGGQDELVFDGNSFVMDATGEVTLRAPAFTEGTYVVDLAGGGGGVQPQPGEIVPLQVERRVFTAPWCRVPATMSTSTAFPGWCWGSRGASIRH